MYLSHQNLFTDGQFGRSLVQHHPKIPPQYSFCSCKWKDTVANQFCNTLTHCVAVEHMGRARKTRKGDGAGVEKEAKRQKLQQTLGDSSAALLSAASPLSTAPTDEDMFGDLLRDEPMGLNPCSDSIDDLLMVREPTQLVSGASQRSVTVQPHTRGVLGKKEQWTRCSEVRSLFQEDPQRPGHPLKIETKNKAGKVIHKIRCRICKNLFSYHNSSWTTASNHVLSHNIYTIEDIASAALLASQAEQSGEPFPIHMLPTPTAIKKDAPGDVQLMKHFVKSPSYGVDSAAYHRVRRSIGKWIAADCLPYRTVQTTAFRAMTRSLDPKCPDFGRKGITAEVGNLLCRRCFPVSSCIVLVSVFHCIVLFFFFATIFIAVEI